MYVFSGSKVMAEYVNGALSKEYVYAGSTLLATHAGANTTYSYPDHLSARVEANQNGTITRTFGNYPFGETWYETGTASKWKFTSYERDSESGLDYAIFRYHSTNLGRFMSPDPLAGNIGNPQSLNRYSYVLNDPVNLVDPLGLDCVSVTTTDEFGNTHSWLECSGGVGGGIGGGGHQPRYRTAELREQGKTFATEFFKLSGGPGNVPTCAEQALTQIAGQFVPISPSGASVIQATAPAAQAVAINQGIAQTQAGIDAYVAARGLTVPLRSSVVRAMAAQGAESAVAAGARANLAVQTLAVDYAAIKSGYLTSKEALSGECSAAFPIF